MKEKLKQKMKQQSMQSLDMPAPKIASEFYTEAEMASFKKVKKKVSDVPALSWSSAVGVHGHDHTALFGLIMRSESICHDYIFFTNRFAHCIRQVAQQPSAVQSCPLAPVTFHEVFGIPSPLVFSHCLLTQ